MRTGLSANTATRYVFGPGAVYVNYQDASERLLGATQGGATFEINTTYRDVEVDGALGKVKGLRRIVAVEATLKVNLLEVTKENLLAALPGSTATDQVTYDQITRSGAIADADYLINVALLADQAGDTDPFVVMLKNVLAQGGLSFNFQGEENELVLPVTFEAFFDPSTPTAEPWEIRRAK